MSATRAYPSGKVSGEAPAQTSQPTTHLAKQRDNHKHSQDDGYGQSKVLKDVVTILYNHAGHEPSKHLQVGSQVSSYQEGSPHPQHLKYGSTKRVGDASCHKLEGQTSLPSLSLRLSNHLQQHHWMGEPLTTATDQSALRPTFGLTTTLHR